MPYAEGLLHQHSWWLEFMYTRSISAAAAIAPLPEIRLEYGTRKEEDSREEDLV